MKLMRTLQGIDTDLHGTPAFLQSLSVDPDHEKHIDPDLENKCIQTNISGMRQRLPLHFIAILCISFMIEILIISVQQSMRLPPAAARLQCRENQGACRGIFYCTTHHS